MAKKRAFEEIFNTEFRWPKFGDQLVVEKGGEKDLAHLDLHPSMRLHMMTQGFKQSADACVDLALNGENEDRDKLIYPIVFNYRQFLELSIKGMLSEYGPYVEVKPNWKSHRLENLWDEFSKLLDEYGTDDPDNIDIVVESCVAEFAKIDPASFSFRYPCDRNGQALSFRQAFLNLENLKNVMNALDAYFLGCDGFLNNRRALMKNMKSDYPAEIDSDC